MKTLYKVTLLVIIMSFIIVQSAGSQFSIPYEDPYYIDTPVYQTDPSSFIIPYSPEPTVSFEAPVVTYNDSYSIYTAMVSNCRAHRFRAILVYKPGPLSCRPLCVYRNL